MAHGTTAQSFDPNPAVAAVLKAFRQGAICPAEMWSQLGRASPREGIRPVLDALDPKLKAALRQAYRDRPLSFEVLREHPLCEVIKLWCEQS
jgi:hypothetical protein